MPKPKIFSSLAIDARLTARGVDIMVNRQRYPVRFPSAVWAATSPATRERLRDNLTYAATLFLPQIFGLPSVSYRTARPAVEPVLFKMGLYDQPVCAATDGKSSLQYVKNFFNTEYNFASNVLNIPGLPKSADRKTLRPIILFSFGKESLLTFALCRRLGIEPQLVLINEPSNTHEFRHKRQLIARFEKQFQTTVHVVDYAPGWFRYGRAWGYQTELGWGVQLFEYCLLSLPFIERFAANTVLVGNEHSCNDWSWDKDGLRMYEAGYDQHSDYLPHQELALSVLAGKQVRIMSLMEPLGEFAETLVLHAAFPELGRFQMSCFADTPAARHTRWCQHCFKCYYTFALLRAIGVDPATLGFTKNLFAKPNPVYDGLLHNHAGARSFGDADELLLAFAWAARRGYHGRAMDKFRRKILPKAGRQLADLERRVLTVHPANNLPAPLARRVRKIYQAALAKARAA